MDIADLNIQLKVNFGNVTTQLAQIQKATQQLANSLEKATNQIANIGKVAESATGKTVQNMQQTASLVTKAGNAAASTSKNLKASLQSASTSINQIGKSAQTTVQKLVEATQTAAKAITTAGEAVHQSLTQMTSGLETLAQTVGVTSRSAIISAQELNKATVAINSNIRTLGTTSGNSASTVINSFDRIRSGAEKAATASQTASTKMQESFTQAANGLRSASVTANQAATTLAANILRAQQAARNLGQAAVEANQKVAGSTGAATQELSNLGGAATNAATTTQQGMKKIEQSSTRAGDTVERVAGDITRSLRDAMTRLDKTTDSLQASIRQLQTTLSQLTNSLSGTAQASRDAAGGLVQLNRRQQDAVSGSANLGRFTRVLTTNILGVNAVAIALGTALGNLGTQVVSRLVLALVNSITQFGRLRAELGQTVFSLNNVSREMEFITEQTRFSGQALEQVGQNWIRLAEEARKAGVSVEVARKAFSDWNQTTSITRQRTLLDTFRQLGTEVGNLIQKIDSRTGLTGAVQKFFERMSQGIRELGENIETTPEPPLLEKLEKQLAELRSSFMERMKNELQLLDKLEKWSILSKVTEHVRQSVAEYVLKTTEEIKKLEEEIFVLRQKGGVLSLERSDEERLTIEKLNVQIQRQLNAELDAAGKKNRAKEYSNKLSEIENQFRQAGIDLTLQELVLLERKYGTQVKQIQELNVGLQASMAKAAQDAQHGIAALTGQRGLIQDIIWSWDEYEQRRLEIEQNIRDSVHESYEAELQINDLRIQEQQRLEQAYWNTAKVGLQALQQIFPKSKGIAIANAIMNTAEGVTMALAKGGPPPLNFIQAGLVAAAGVAQIAAIRGANSSGGGSAPRPSGNVSTPSTSTQPTGPTNAVQIVIPRGDIWSSERVAELIGRINDEVGNGRTLISTRTKPS